MGANRNSCAGYRMGPSLTPTPPNTPNRGVEKPPFEIAAKSATADCTHHVGWSSGLITIVVMTLLNVDINGGDGEEMNTQASLKSDKS